MRTASFHEGDGVGPRPKSVTKSAPKRINFGLLLLDSVLGTLCRLVGHSLLTGFFSLLGLLALFCLFFCVMMGAPFFQDKVIAIFSHEEYEGNEEQPLLPPSPCDFCPLFFLVEGFDFLGGLLSSIFFEEFF